MKLALILLFLFGVPLATLWGERRESTEEKRHVLRLADSSARAAARRSGHRKARYSSVMKKAPRSGNSYWGAR